MANFEGRHCHPACWTPWPLRDRFVATFNGYAEDAVLRDDGSVQWLAADGTVREQETGLFVV